MQGKITQVLKEIQAGNYQSLARGITILENNIDGYSELLQNLEHTDKAKVIGITGPPGAGKSTLVNALIRSWLADDKKIAVIAVDPSSPFNYGALLGDRIRMAEYYNHPSVFIRSLATRGALGGLNAKIIEITDLLKNAPFDYILVETVGVGQSEVEIAGLADCTIVALVPEAGDEVQTLKAGIMEIADIFVVNKADRESAETLYRNLKIMVHEKATGDEETPVVKTIATEYSGITDLRNAIDKFLVTHTGHNEKYLQLLADKCLQLIQQERMKDINRKDITRKLGEAINKPGFNLYTFTASFSK